MFCRMTKQQREIIIELVEALVERRTDGVYNQRLRDVQVAFENGFKCQSPIDDAAEEHY